MADGTEKLYTDASYCDGKSGMAVVAPEWAANLGAKWRANWDIRVAHVPERNAVVFYASCRCKDINDAEKRAIGMAFLLANDMMRAFPGIRVEILSDSLTILDRIMSGNIGDMRGDPIMEDLCRRWNQREIILTKVRAHNGHWGNELADAWAKRARRELGDRIHDQGWQAQRGQAPWGQNPRPQPAYQCQYQTPYQYQNQYQNQSHYQPPYQQQYQDPYQAQYPGQYQDHFRR